MFVLNFIASRRRCLFSSMLTVCLACLIGCDGKSAQMINHGTTGSITFNGASIGDLQVTVFTNTGGTFRQVAFGISNPQGDFFLIDNSGRKPWTLIPGEYVLTVDSVAADPVPIPQLYTRPTTTPLNRTWTLDDDLLAIDLKYPERQN